MAYRHNIYLWLTAVALLVFNGRSVRAVTPRFSFFGRKSTNSTAPSPGSSWSSFLTVDPSKILATLIQRGGLILPASLQNELLAIIKVCHVADVQWNPVEKRLLFTNFTVSLPGLKHESLRVGKLFVSWESYAKPCLNIEIEDVDLLVEFTNLFLTKTNWNELWEHGFPPPMISEIRNNRKGRSPSSTSSFVRIGSMDLSGTLRVNIQSRPLNNQDLCPPWELNLDNFDDWNTELQHLSNQNLIETGRRGCTTLQFYDWIGRNVNTMVRTNLLSTAYDLASQPFAEHDSIRRAKGFLKEARTSVWSYAVQASRKTGKDMQDNIVQRLETLGIQDKVHEALSKLSISHGNNETHLSDDNTITQVMAAYEALRNIAQEKLLENKGALQALEEADIGQPEVILPDHDL